MAAARPPDTVVGRDTSLLPAAFAKSGGVREEGWGGGCAPVALRGLAGGRPPRGRRGRGAILDAAYE